LPWCFPFLRLSALACSLHWLPALPRPLPGRAGLKASAKAQAGLKPFQSSSPGVLPLWHWPRSSPIAREPPLRSLRWPVSLRSTSHVSCWRASCCSMGCWPWPCATCPGGGPASSQPHGRVPEGCAEPSSASRPCAVGSIDVRRGKVQTEKDHEDEEPKNSMAADRNFKRPDEARQGQPTQTEGARTFGRWRTRRTPGVTLRHLPVPVSLSRGHVTLRPRCPPIAGSPQRPVRYRSKRPAPPVPARRLDGR